MQIIATPSFRRGDDYIINKRHVIPFAHVRRGCNIADEGGR